tara:strand:+ start:768 stop:1544 length:777 start_codon:yes stop_codon:yes gene_type:complete
MIIDSHCHLTYDPMISSLDETIGRANKDGVKYLLTICTEDKGYIKILDIVNNYKCVYGTYGIHPHEAKNYKDISSEYIISQVKKSSKIIGVGETGLDFFYNHSDKKDQIKSFLEHIDASHKTNLPLIVHTRSAEMETLKILKEATRKKNLKILIHCFTGSKKFAFDLLDIGAYISASGVVTFKKSQDLAEAFKEIPTNRILVETDSPYLAPVPLRGKPNEPSFIIHTLKFLSDLKNIPFDKLAKSTTQNFFDLFGKLN